MEEVEHVAGQAGLALGGSRWTMRSSSMAAVSILNEDGLRFDDEFVRHKILDSIGDLYLAGAPLIGHFQGVRSGHALNHDLLRTLLANDTAWRYTTNVMAQPSRQAQNDHDVEPSVAIA